MLTTYNQVKQQKSSIPTLPVTSTKDTIEGAEFNFSDLLQDKVTKTVGYKMYVNMYIGKYTSYIFHIKYITAEDVLTNK